MYLPLRPRRLIQAALTVTLVAAVAACGRSYPDSIFHSHTEFNREVGSLFSLLIWLGTAVFVFVEAILVYTLIRFRHRENAPEPEHMHGNSTLEILWTSIPAVILIIIAVPTVRTIFRTQAPAPANSVQVEVIGHQWWWEFRYPQYTTHGANGRVDTVKTANELYLPLGRTASFTLKSADVIHSFWAPSMGGKRDVVSNHTNYLWYTPDSAGVSAWNGACAEYCGTSHANMRFKVFTVTPQEFASWIAHQQQPAPYTPSPAAGASPTSAAASAAGTQTTPAAAQATAVAPANASAPVNPATPGASAAQAPLMQASFIAFPREKIPDYAVPKTPTPAGLTFDESLKGDPANGAKILATGMPGACLGCHTITGIPTMLGQIGPNLTHVGGRSSIAGGLYPNDTRHLALWIKNARLMKPGVLMPTLGQGQFDPILKSRQTAGLTDQQIADVVAYLQTLK